VGILEGEFVGTIVNAGPETVEVGVWVLDAVDVHTHGMAINDDGVAGRLHLADIHGMVLAIPDHVDPPTAAVDLQFMRFFTDREGSFHHWIQER